MDRIPCRCRCQYACQCIYGGDYGDPQDCDHRALLEEYWHNPETAKAAWVHDCQGNDFDDYREDDDQDAEGEQLPI